MATGIVPYEGYQAPYWWPIIQTARYLHVHPEEVMAAPSFWVRVAQAAIDIENHVQEVRAQRSR